MPDVGAALEQMRRDRVPQRVAGHVLLDPRLLRVVADHQAHERAVEVAAAVGDEEVGRARAAHDRGAALLEVGVERCGGGARERDVAVLPALAEQHAQRPIPGVDVVGRELGEFAHADAGRVEGLEHRSIAQCARRRRLARGAQEAQRFLLREDHARQPLLQARQLDRGCRVLHHVVPAVEKTEEALHHDEALRLARDGVRTAVLFPRGVEVALVREEVVRPHRDEVDAALVEPREEGAHEGDVAARRPLDEARLQVVAVEAHEALRPRGHTALLVFVAR